MRNFMIGKAVLLASYTWGGHARRLTAMREEDVIQKFSFLIKLIKLILKCFNNYEKFIIPKIH